MEGGVGRWGGPGKGRKRALQARHKVRQAPLCSIVSLPIFFFCCFCQVKSAICQAETAAALRAYESSFPSVFLLAKLLFPLFAVCCWQGYWVESFLLFGLVSSLGLAATVTGVCEWVKLETALAFVSQIFGDLGKFTPFFLPQQVCFMANPFSAHDIFTLNNFALGSSF